MKILWFVNVPLPEVSNLLDETPIPYGGWLVSASSALTRSGIELNISFPYKCNLDPLTGESITYYPFKSSRGNARPDISQIEKIIYDVKPDLIHIFGTEYDHTLEVLKIANKIGKQTVISIQGLTTMIVDHYFSGLSFKTIHSKSFRNIIFQDNIYNMKKKFLEKSKREIEALNMTSYVIGRTNWDRASVSQINKNINYFFCNETLRNSFYENKWEYEKCDRFTIFISQASYPIKGFHYFLKALVIIKKEFPNVKVYVSGNDPTNKSTIKNYLKRDYYGIYIEKMIKKLGLSDNIIFTGILSETEMVQRLLKTNVFVSPSTIENSPNSVGEAMIMGVPTVSSYVGGVMDMLEHGKEGFLYQSDAPYMLAYFVKKIFNEGRDISFMTENAIRKARTTHNQIKNNEKLIEIYKTILENEGNK